jgi:hypothetical protein
MRNRQIAADWEMKIACVKMDEIELVNVFDDMVYQENFPGHGVFAALILP